VYELVQTFPSSERYNLRDQVVRAAASMPLNIAEGSARRYKKEFAQSIRIALGSMHETVTALKLAERLKYITKTDHEGLSPVMQELYFKLVGLEKSLLK
jgi:four helix bundle protein